MRAALLLVLVTTTTASAAPWLWQKPGTYLNDLAVAPDGSVAVYAGHEVVLLGRDGKERARDGSFDGRTASIQGVAFAPDGDLVVAGYFRRSMTIGGKQLVAGNDDEEGVVARYAPDGKLRWATPIRAGTSASIKLWSVTASKTGVLAVGAARPKLKEGKLDNTTGGGFVVLLDVKGAEQRRQVLDPGSPGDNVLRYACATDGGFVAVGEQRPAGDETTVVHGLRADGTAAWSYTVENSRGDRVACLGDRAFASARGRDKVSLIELDAAGKAVQTIVVDTKGRTETLSIAVSGSEIAISTRVEVKNTVASRVSRFTRAGKLLGADEYASTAGADPIWIRAGYGPKGLVLAGEAEKAAKVKIRGQDLTGPTLFVVGP